MFTADGDMMRIKLSSNSLSMQVFVMCTLTCMMLCLEHASHITAFKLCIVCTASVAVEGPCPALAQELILETAPHRWPALRSPGPGKPGRINQCTPHAHHRTWQRMRHVSQREVASLSQGRPGLLSASVQSCKLSQLQGSLATNSTMQGVWRRKDGKTPHASAVHFFMKQLGAPAHATRMSVAHHAPSHAGAEPRARRLPNRSAACHIGSFECSPTSAGIWSE